MPRSKKKLEELVTKHLGGERDVSGEDVKSSVLHGQHPPAFWLCYCCRY